MKQQIITKVANWQSGSNQYKIGGALDTTTTDMNQVILFCELLLREAPVLEKSFFKIKSKRTRNTNGNLFTFEERKYNDFLFVFVLFFLLLCALGSRQSGSLGKSRDEAQRVIRGRR